MKTLMTWKLCQTADALTGELQHLAFTTDASILADEVAQVVNVFIDRLEAWIERARPSLRQQGHLVRRVYAIRCAEEQALRRLQALSPRVPERRRLTGQVH
jgi:hypothetical protein